VSTADRRTFGELLAESDALARETLLDATLEHAPAMVRSWNQLVGSAADLWTVLVSAQLVRLGSGGTVAGSRGSDRPQRHERALAWARTN